MTPPIATEGTTAHLREVAENVTEWTGIIGTCRQAANKTASRLTKHLPEQYVHTYEGTIEPIIADTAFEAVSGRAAYHWYVVVDAGCITDVQAGRGTPVVLDPTVAQFTHENMRKHDVEVAVTPEEHLPDVGIFTPEDPEYDWYTVR